MFSGAKLSILFLVMCAESYSIGLDWPLWLLAKKIMHCCPVIDDLMKRCHGEHEVRGETPDEHIMADILQTTFSKALSCKTVFEFRLIFHRSMFPMTRSTIGSGSGSKLNKRQAIIKIKITQFHEAHRPHPASRDEKWLQTVRRRFHLNYEESDVELLTIP